MTKNHNSLQKSPWDALNFTIFMGGIGSALTIPFIPIPEYAGIGLGVCITVQLMLPRWG